MNPLLWAPSPTRVESTHLYKFQKSIAEKYAKKFSDYQAFHQWTVEHKENFWNEVIEFFGMCYSGSRVPALVEDHFRTYSWYPNIQLNFAENLLKHRAKQTTGLNFVHESGFSLQYSHKDLYHMAASLHKVLKLYINEGDVLAAYMPNIPQTVIAMLATTAMGGVFTSTSCDFGVQGVVDRFGQCRPKVLIAAVGYTYNGKYFDQREKIKKIHSALPSVEKIILVDFLNRGEDGISFPEALIWEDIVEFNHVDEMPFKRVAFKAPLYIMYSSGTTGKPKCIVHSVGGTYLQHIKELALQTDHQEHKNIFYFTTCGWMMWNWLVSSLAIGGCTVLYEGSPGYPDLLTFFKMIEREKIHIFGTSPKFLKALQDAGWDQHSPLASLETILSTGSPLLPEQFDFVYEKIKKDVALSSICGGTDIIGCFMGGNPLLPVKRGEIQSLSLGMAVNCYDESGQALLDGEGELVCEKTFPSRPLGFLNDPQDEKFKAAYFNKYPGVWHHGDFIRITESAGVQVYGRSDATLNPGGVRIGTAEIYRLIENMPYIQEALCVGKNQAGDVQVLLFVKMQEGEALTPERIVEMQTAIKKGTTARHVPQSIIAVSGIPTTRSGKKMELAVTRLINGKPLANREAVANPECLAQYSSFSV